MSYTGPDPRQESTERYDATLTMTITVSLDLTTSAVQSEDDELDRIAQVCDALEALGYNVNLTKSNLEAK